jgi:hypothetical protein
MDLFQYDSKSKQSCTGALTITIDEKVQEASLTNKHS